MGPVGRKLSRRSAAPSAEPAAAATQRPIQPLGRGCVPIAAAMFLVIPLAIILASCEGGGEGLPEAPGTYQLKERSVTFDGDRYSFLWADAGGTLQRATTRDVKLMLAESNELEITADGDAILRLRQDEPVTVEGRDQQGDFGSFWYPFIVGQIAGGGGVAPGQFRDPVYRFPPTDRLDRGDTITGNTASTTNRLPDYGRLAPVGGAVSGQAGGAGGGQAATNRAQSSATTSGQSGGTGAGSAALNKSGSFRAGEHSYAGKVDSGELNPISGRSEPRVGAGSGARTGSSGSTITKPKIDTGRSSAPSARSSSGSGGSTPRISTTRRR